MAIRAELPDRLDADRKQIEFPPLETHDKRFEAFMVGLSLLCVVIVLVIVLGTDIGNPAR
jgi:hypothetical protein